MLLHSIKLILGSFGYNVQDFIINSSDSIVPQSRPRLWIVAIRGDSYFEGFVPPEPLPFHPKLANGYLETDLSPCILPTLGKGIRRLERASLCKTVRKNIKRAEKMVKKKMPAYAIA